VVQSGADATGRKTTEAAKPLVEEGFRRLVSDSGLFSPNAQVTLRGFDTIDASSRDHNELRNPSSGGAAQSGAVAEPNLLTAFIATLTSAQRSELVALLTAENKGQ
jgi:hypothetical protein